MTPCIFDDVCLIIPVFQTCDERQKTSPFVSFSKHAADFVIGSFFNNNSLINVYKITSEWFSTFGYFLCSVSMVSPAVKGK